MAIPVLSQITPLSALDGAEGATVNYTPTIVGGGSAAGQPAGSVTTTLSGTVSWSVLSGALAVSSSGVLTTTGTAPSNPSGATIAATVYADNGADGVGKHIAVPVAAYVAPAVSYLPAVAAAPTAVYAMHKLLSGYSGPLASACATSDTAATPTMTVDIPANADGTPDYSAAQTAFGLPFSIWRQYDQTGQHEAAVQNDSTLRGIVKWPTSGVIAMENGTLVLPASITTSRLNCTAFSLNSGSNFNNSPVGMFSVGASDELSWSGNTYGASIRTNVGKDVAVSLDQNLGVLTLRGASGGITAWSNERRGDLDLSAIGNAALSGGQLGRDSQGSLGYATYTENLFNAGFVLYATSLSDADVAAVQTFFYQRFSIPTTRTFGIVAIGDSIQAGLGASTGRNKWWWLQDQLDAKPYVYNLAIGGTGTSGQLDVYTADKLSKMYNPNASVNLVVDNAGTNDLEAVTASQLWAEVQTVISRFQAAGFTYVRETVIPGTPSGNESQRQMFNQLLRDNAGATGFFLIDYGENTSIPRVDGVHPTEIGYQNMAAVAKPVLNAALVPPALAFSKQLKPTAYVGYPYTSQPVVKGGYKPYTFSATGLPSGWTLDPHTGKVTGLPSTGGNVSVTYTVTDAKGSSLSSTTTTIAVTGASSLWTPQQLIDTYGASKIKFTDPAAVGSLTVDSTTQNVTAIANIGGLGGSSYSNGSASASPAQGTINGRKALVSTGGKLLTSAANVDPSSTTSITYACAFAGAATGDNGDNDFFETGTWNGAAGAAIDVAGNVWGSGYSQPNGAWTPPSAYYTPTNMRDGKPHAFIVTYGASPAAVRLDGVDITTSSKTGTFVAASSRLNSPFNVTATIGPEVLAFTPLTSDEAARLEGYMAWAAGTADNLPVGSAYASAPPLLS